MKKKRFIDMAKDTLDFPVGCGAGESCVEILGKKCVHVRGCKRIIGYESELITLEICEGRLDISGEGLYFSSYSRGAIEICGSVQNVSFSEVSGCC